MYTWVVYTRCTRKIYTTRGCSAAAGSTKKRRKNVFPYNGFIMLNKATHLVNAVIYMQCITKSGKRPIN